MPKKITVDSLPEFDLARQLRNEADIAEYITQVIEEGDAAELAHALGVAARARGMSEIAQATGLTREALYKALRPWELRGQGITGTGELRGQGITGTVYLIDSVAISDTLHLWPVSPAS